MIIIKKYPNRRLYDTSESQYVNLEFIKSLVLKHREFKVVDSKTRQDLTKSILLQIISEQEGDEEQSLLTNSVLKQLIRFYGSEMQVFVRPYLEKSLATFIARQDTIQGFLDKVVNPKSFDSFSQILEEGMEKWARFTFGKAASQSNQERNKEANKERDVESDKKKPED